MRSFWVSEAGRIAEVFISARSDLCVGQYFTARLQTPHFLPESQPIIIHQTKEFGQRSRNVRSFSLASPRWVSLTPPPTYGRPTLFWKPQQQPLPLPPSPGAYRNQPNSSSRDGMAARWNSSPVPLLMRM